MSTFQQEIPATCKQLNSGKLILYPTDTVWGIGCDATNRKAVDNVYRLKKRPSRKGLILLVDSIQRLSKYVETIPPKATELINTTDHPLTIIYPNAQNLPSNVTAPDGSIGIRITDHQFCRPLIEQFGKPIVSTSANVSGSPTPSSKEDIQPEILSQVDYVVNLRLDQETKKPSTIVQILSDQTVQYIRR